MTKEIRRLSLNGTVTPGTTPPSGSNIPSSGRSSEHDSLRSAPPLPHCNSYFSDSASPSPDSDQHGYPLPTKRYPTPPPQCSYPSQSLQHPYPSHIRPPPAVARIAGKEKKKNVNAQATYPAPTSHPVIPPQKESQGISGIISWGKNKDTKGENKWEPGVIGRERARVLVDGGKR